MSVDALVKSLHNYCEYAQATKRFADVGFYEDLIEALKELERSRDHYFELLSIYMNHVGNQEGVTFLGICAEGALDPETLKELRFIEFAATDTGMDQ